VTEAGLQSERRLLARLSVDGSGDASVDTGVPVLDHLVALTARYARFDLVLEVAPETAQAQIAAAGRALGGGVADALATAGARGHGFGSVPSEEALAEVVLDRSERPVVVSNVDLSSVHLAGLETDLVAGFLDELARAAGIALHVRLAHGDEEQHVLDAIFKALGVALGEACRP
jgi:imidazoleglycerol-phosphate dehydratase